MNTSEFTITVFTDLQKGDILHSFMIQDIASELPIDTLLHIDIEDLNTQKKSDLVDLLTKFKKSYNAISIRTNKNQEYVDLFKKLGFLNINKYVGYDNSIPMLYSKDNIIPADWIEE